MTITIEYCVACGYERRATLLAEHLRASFHATVTLVEGSGGAFEVSADGRPVYSKKQTGRFPTDEEVVDALEGR